MTVWFYLAFALPACCVFAVGVGASAQIRSMRLLLALILAYVCLVLDAKSLADYNNEGLASDFTMLLGWLPSIIYVWLLECIWRAIYRKKIRAHENFASSRLNKGIAIVGFALLVICVLYFAGGLMSIYADSISTALFNLFTYLSDVRFNFWFYLFFLLPPLLIFSVRPEKKTWLRVLRTLVAVASAYVLINLSLQTHQTIKHRTYRECQKVSGGMDNYGAHAKCKHLSNMYSGSSNVFYLFLGWIPGAAYVGIWELAWRRYHRQQLAKAQASFRWRWITSFPIWMLYLCLSYPIIATIVVFVSYWGQWSLLFQK